MDASRRPRWRWAPRLHHEGWASILYEALTSRRKGNSQDEDRPNPVPTSVRPGSNRVREANGRDHVPHEVVLTVNDIHNRNVCKTIPLTASERHQAFRPTRWPSLTPECKSWCDYNTPGYKVRNNPAANFLIDIVFKNDSDAALFKVFWL